jgi:glutaryl-CoA dehydrogenase
MAAFDGVDYYQIDSLLSEDEIMVRSSVRQLVDDHILPTIGKHYEEATFPSEVIPKMAELGLLGMKLEGYGCAGMNNVQYGLACQELERGDSGIRSFMSVQSSLCMYPIWEFGSEAQKEKWLPGMQQGKLIGCFGLTEPDAGSDPGSMKTTAKKKEKNWILKGSKMWITNGSVADLAIVWAKTDDGVKGFVVEKGMKGFSAPLMEHKMSLRASVTSELVFDDVVLPEENRLPEANGLKAALMCLNTARYGISWGAIGAAMACYTDVLNYTKERKQFKKPLASFQLIQNKLAWMVTEITKMQLLALQLGREVDKGTVRPQMISMAKMNNVSTALEIARAARDMMGANGISLEYSPIRHATNLEGVNTYEGTHDIHRLIIGEDITGISAFG